MDAFFGWSGLLAFLVGLLSIIKPLSLLQIETRKDGALVALAGLVLFVIAAW